MNIKELYRQVNIKLVEKRENMSASQKLFSLIVDKSIIGTALDPSKRWRPITEEEFIEALSTLEAKGLIRKVGDEVYVV